ncbi:MAG: MFS transporter [Gammaproteobacteria bacterium]|nr:MFS transporter [Gammaproteobacteria bacterium]
MDHILNRPWLILSSYRWTRISVFTTFYFAQGIPIGLFTVAMPIYLANTDHSIQEISVYGATIGLPWAFKLIVGPFMDRFTFLPMGFRRPWVITTQSGLVLSMFLFALVSLPGDPSLLSLIAFGFLCNVFSASQDVATDGMAIDILHDDERGKANAFMAFGQTMGFSSFGAVSGYLLVAFNVATTAAVATMVIGLIWLVAIVTRERPGEKMLPWTPGKTAEVAHRRDPTFMSIFQDLLKVVFLPMSLILVFMELFYRMRDGVALAVIPKYASDVLSISTDEYSYFVGIVGIVSAVIGVMVGPFIDKFGAKRFVILALSAGVVVHLIAWFIQATGEATVTASCIDAFAWACLNLKPTLTTMATLYVVLSIVGQVIFVTTIAIFMTICWQQVSATQFAIYMSLANLSRTVGGALFAIVAEYLDWSLNFLLMAVLLGIATIIVSFFNPQSHREQLAKLDNAET